MRLDECKKGQKLEVVKLHAGDALKHRLISFGIIKGAKIEFMAKAPKGKTIEIKVDKMQVALRDQEAQLIEVKEI